MQSHQKSQILKKKKLNFTNFPSDILGNDEFGRKVNNSFITDDPEDELLMQKPKKRKRKRFLNNGLTRQEKELIVQCEKFTEKYPNCANLTIPSEENPESKAYETFVLPSGDLDTYKSLPKVCFLI